MNSSRYDSLMCVLLITQVNPQHEDRYKKKKRKATKRNDMRGCRDFTERHTGGPKPILTTGEHTLTKALTQTNSETRLRKKDKRKDKQGLLLT
ncbi:hypothetical protein EON65_04050 [archaeon]|nr:MAG: hypothetical protein EON65_04050 [archaeon]